MITRRRFLASSLAPLLVSPARAESRTYVIGYLSGGAQTPPGLAKPLAELGYVEGRNLRYETRIVDMNRPGTVRAMAADLTHSNVDLLLTWVTDRVEALAEATKTIPIVAGLTADPVGQGLAKTLRQPGGNVTGLSAGIAERAHMQIALFRAMRPRLERVVFVHRVVEANARDPWDNVARPIAEEGAKAGVKVFHRPVADAAQLGRVFDELGDPLRAGAMHGPRLPDGIDISGVALRRKIALHGDPESGALMQISLGFVDPNRSIVAMIDKILRGVSPGDIPFETPDRSDLILNRATAKAIGVTFSPDLLLRASKIYG